MDALSSLLSQQKQVLACVGAYAGLSAADAAQTPRPTIVDFKAAREVVRLLEPLRRAVTDLSGSVHPSSPRLINRILVIYTLMNKALDASDTSDEGKALARALVNKLQMVCGGGVQVFVLA